MSHLEAHIHHQKLADHFRGIANGGAPSGAPKPSMPTPPAAGGGMGGGEFDGEDGEDPQWHTDSTARIKRIEAVVASMKEDLREEKRSAAWARLVFCLFCSVVTFSGVTLLLRYGHPLGAAGMATVFGTLFPFVHAAWEEWRELHKEEK
jgi:hypothetical protein